MTTLKEALDRIWQDEEPRLSAASAALIDMDDNALVSMIKLFLMAEEDRLIIDDRVEHGTLYLRYREGGGSTLAHIGASAASNALIRLTDIDKSLVANDDSFKMAWGVVREHNACSILAAEQFARDHIDTLLYEPVEIRERSLKQVSASLGISAEVLVKLAYQVRTLGPPSLPSKSR